MLSLGAPKIYDMPIVQAIFEGNVIQLSELITQREEVNAPVHILYIIIHTHTYMYILTCVIRSACAYTVHTHISVFHRGGWNMRRLDLPSYSSPSRIYNDSLIASK